MFIPSNIFTVYGYPINYHEYTIPVYIRLHKMDESDMDDWGLNKMAGILQKAFSNAPHQWKVWIPTKIYLQFVPNVPTDERSALVQVMAWHRTDNKPLPEIMLSTITDVTSRHYVTMSERVAITFTHCDIMTPCDVSCRGQHYFG